MNHEGTAGATDRPLLIVISTGPQPYREYVFASIHGQYRIHLLHTVEPTWQKPYLVGWTVVPSTEPDVLIAAARAVAAREPVHGVLSWDEARIHQTALVAAELGLPTTDPDAVWGCRDKFRSRTALAAAGLSQPRFRLVGTVEEALDAAAEIGFPVVLKPRAASASYGVVLVRDEVELVAFFRFSADATVPHMPRYSESVLVEEYLDGPEVSIDSVVRDGVVRALFVAHKETGFAPYFEETGHFVAAADPVLADPAAMRLLQDTHSALGFTDGWTHAEFRVTSDGLAMIEVNGRLGGDLIPYLGMRATGVDPGLIAAAVACGREPDIRSDRELVAAVRFFYPGADDTVIDSVRFDEAAVPDSTELTVLAAPGDIVSRPPRGLVSGRIAFAVAVTPSRDDCAAALLAAKDALHVNTTVPAGTPQLAADQ